MALSELETIATQDPAAAEARIAQIVANANVAELSRIAGTTRLQFLRLRAIEGLGQVGGSAASAALTSLLKAASGPFLIGGTEQRLEHEAQRIALTQALARATGGRGAPPSPATT
jgi:hypothetical protein